MNKSKGLCQINSVFGRTLHEGVIFVGIATSVIASVTFVTSIFAIGMIATKKLAFKKNPVLAANLITALVFCPMSVYQVIISLLLLFQALKLGGNVFLTSVWITSHFSILVIYSILFVGKTIVCFYFDYALMGVVLITCGILYVAVLIYFEIIVNSYLDTLDSERYY